MIQVDRRIFLHFDYVLILLILPIIATSYFLVHELSPALAHKQLVYFGMGAIAFGFFFLLPIRRMLWLIPLFYWLNILMLVALYFLGVTKLGAKRWLELPFVHFTVQPSEIMKVAFIMMLAYLIYQHPPDERSGYGLKDFAKFSIYILIPFLLIAGEPDLGSALILLFVGYGVLFIIGVNYRIWIAIFLALAIAEPLIYANLKPYQKRRISDFLAEKPSYHVRQSIIAIGSGGLTGQPREGATQTHLKFLPIAVSDFIFAFFIERFGFWGGVALMTLYGLIVLYLMLMVLYMKSNYLIQSVAASLALLIFLYSGVNIAMTIGYAPVVGLPLPLFSYGGTSFITFMILLGILENLLSFRHDRLYDAVRFGEE